MRLGVGWPPVGLTVGEGPGDADGPGNTDGVSLGDSDGDGDSVCVVDDEGSSVGPDGPTGRGTMTSSPQDSGSSVRGCATSARKTVPAETSAAPELTPYQVEPSFETSCPADPTSRRSGSKAREALAVSASSRPSTRVRSPNGAVGRTPDDQSGPTLTAVPAHNSATDPPRNVSRARERGSTETLSPEATYTWPPRPNATGDPFTTATVVPRSTRSSAWSALISAQAGPGMMFAPVSSSARSSSRTTSHHRIFSNRRSAESSTLDGGGPGGAASGG